MSDSQNYVKTAIKNLNKLDRLIKSQKLDEALEIASAAYDILKDSTEKIKFAEACSYIAEIWFKKADFQKAYQFYNEAAGACVDLLISDLSINYLKNAISCLQYEDNVATIIKKVDESVSIARPVAYKHEIGSLLSIGGNILFNKRAWNDALTYFIQSFELGGSTLQRASESLYNVISICFFKICKWVDSILNGKVVLGLVDIYRNPKKVIDQTVLIARAYMRLFDYDNAFYYSSKAAEYFERLLNIEFIDACIVNLEVNYFFRKTAYAIKLSDKYIEIVERQKMDKELAVILYWAGKIESEVNRDTAINYFNESLEICDEQNLTKTKLECLMEIARINLSYGRITETCETIERCKKIAEVSKDAEIQAIVYERSGLLNYLMKNYEDGLDDFLKSAEYYKQEADIYEEHNAYYNCACIYAILGNDNEMYSLLRKIVNMDIRFSEMARADPDFASKYNDPEFIQIVGKN